MSHNDWLDATIDLSAEQTEEGLIGWAAGIYEGEGCFSMRWSTSRNQNKRYPQIAIVSTDLDVLEDWKAIVGYGNINLRKTKNPLGQKPIYCLTIGARSQIVKVIEMLWPYLSNRRRQSIMDGLDECKLAVA